MNTANGHLPLQAPGLGFEFVRLDRTSLSLDAAIIVHHIGIYPTLAIAQVAAQENLQLTLNNYLRAGRYGRYFNEIDLEQRGLITAYQETSVDGYKVKREVAMSEFRVVTVNARDSAREAESRLSRERPSFQNSRGGSVSNMQGTGAVMTIIRLPVQSDQHNESVTPNHIAKQRNRVIMPEPAPPSPQLPQLGAQYDQERQPEWSQTRISLFDRRDDGPFRRLGDRPYAQVMILSPPAPTAPVHSALQASGDSLAGAAATA